MLTLLMPVLQACQAGLVSHGSHTPRKGPGEETEEDQEGLELPVNPDQGTPLIPDEEGDIPVPG